MGKNTEISERIKYLIENEGISINDFAKKLGYNRSQSIYDILNNKAKPSFQFFDKFYNTEYSAKYNPDWLITGKGPMLRNEVPTQGEPVSNKRTIPLITVDAFAGLGAGDMQIQDYAIEDNYVVPDFEQVDFLIRVKGSSMIPTYNSGDIVACREIFDRSVIIWGRIYVLHDKENGTLIKRLFPSDKKDTVICRSDNSKHYPDFEVKLNNLTNLALVVGGIKIE